MIVIYNTSISVSLVGGVVVSFVFSTEVQDAPFLAWLSQHSMCLTVIMQLYKSIHCMGHTIHFTCTSFMELANSFLSSLSLTGT